MTKEQSRISYINHKKAREYFGIADKKGYHLHHIDPMMKKENIERYILWLVEDLVVMTNSEHSKWHATHRHWDIPHWELSDETKQKMSESRMGHSVSDETRLKISEGNKGKPKSEEHRKHISEGLSGKPRPNCHTNKGRHWTLIDGKRVYSA